MRADLQVVKMVKKGLKVMPDRKVQYTIQQFSTEHNLVAVKNNIKQQDLG